MTHLVLGTMRTMGGFVINVSSGASVLPHDLYVGYASCKAYVNKFTEDMNREYNKDGIVFQCQTPLYVTSKMSKIRKTSLTVASPEQYARACNSHIGYAGIVSPVFIHALILMIFEFVPSFFIETMITSMHRMIRARALKKNKKSN